MNRKQRRAARNIRPIGAAPVAPSACQLARTALAYSASGNHTASLHAVVAALAVEESDLTCGAFIDCVRAMQFFEDNAAVRNLVSRALRENWGRPEHLALPAADLIKAAGTDLPALARDPLLLILLRVTPNQDAVLEDSLVAARAALLRTPDDAMLNFHCALAQQCFLNEYVWTCSDEERHLADYLEQEIAAALNCGVAVAPSKVAALATYRPLRDMRLANQQWPANVDALLTQQLRDPAQEKTLAAALPRLTAISDPVSRKVAGQYEENPYPRWTHAGRPRAVGAGAPGPQTCEINNILVAGCGTGRDAIETAQTFPAARILAVDLSRASLGHAARKARQMGIRNVEFAQADILEIETLDRRFDLIEAVGVLHHLAEPFSGWRSLLGLLNSGGAMKVGLYSPIARKNLARARQALPAHDFPATPDGIRAARRYLLGRSEFADVTQRPDFFTLSNCRDLLFHVQEKAVSLDAIAAFLREEGLKVLGFDLETPVLADYRAKFSGDPQASSLDNWAAFEAEHPATFDGMYQFWVERV
ncbi:MAG TPA: class I SAM-dependent methyltransferase [Rhizomicrobium sp.]|jgi:SAM-dependent methyltransferase|nr:class I SAM-dependent methyltransferase [Rhizomicrobium sp.]